MHNTATHTEAPTNTLLTVVKKTKISGTSMISLFTSFGSPHNSANFRLAGQIAGLHALQQSQKRTIAGLVRD